MSESATTERIERTTALMDKYDIDLLLAAPSADLRYLTGYAGRASERPTLLAVGHEIGALLVIAELEAPRLLPTSVVRIVPYREAESPFVMLAETIGSPAPGSRIAVTDQTWAKVLLDLQASFPAATFVSATPLLRQMRMVKSPEELQLLEVAARLSDAAFGEIVEVKFSGKSEREIAMQLQTLLREQGLVSADWGPIVASGVNSASPHHMTTDREIREGDAVVLDFGGALDGYQSDTTRTVHVGSASEEFCRVYDVVHQAQQAGVDAVRRGVPAQEVDRAARSVIESAGHGAQFVHRTGHGIGLDGHEEPYIIEGNTLELEPAMTFSVEPGIYLPGRYGVRIEDIVAVTEDGALRLNEASRDLIIVH